MLHTVSDTLPTYADVVDLARYPIHRLDSDEGRALINSGRRALAQDGCCTLPGFLQPTAVAEMVQLANRLERSAWVSNNRHNVYFEPFDNSVEPGHPLAHQECSAKHGIAYDQIPDQAPLRRLYESDDLTRFIAAVLEKSVLLIMPLPFISWFWASNVANKYASSAGMAAAWVTGHALT